MKNTDKSLIEILLTPLVVAIVGVVGTYLITQQQLKSSALMSQVQRESSENLARTEQQIKILEIFSQKITSTDIREREVAVRILQAVEPALAEKIATAIAQTESEDSQVRKVAKAVAEEEAGKGFSFPVVGSFTELNDAVVFAKKLMGQDTLYGVEIYLSENNYYAVTLGGKIKFQEAFNRVEYAKKQNIARDAYVWTSRNWRDNLFQ